MAEYLKAKIFFYYVSKSKKLIGFQYRGQITILLTEIFCFIVGTILPEREKFLILLFLLVFQFCNQNYFISKFE